MQLQAKDLTYEWIDNWITVPDHACTCSGEPDGRTHGVAVSHTGDVFIFHQAKPALLHYSPDGELKNSWGEDFPGAHGLTLVEEDGQELLWLVDSVTGRVLKTTLTGEVLLEIHQPDHPVYQQGAKYSPTWVAVNETRFGGNGDVWLADGYGSSLIHRYDASGKHLHSISGDEGAGGKFNCPHGISFRFDPAGNELVIADRGNRQIQVYDAQGRFIRAFGQDVLHSPCVVAFDDGRWVVPELLARVTILNADGSLVGYLGETPDCRKIPGWPNVSADALSQGRFNSPHSLAVSPQGDLYVVEWIIGGRVTKLARA